MLFHWCLANGSGVFSHEIFRISLSIFSTMGDFMGVFGVFGVLGVLGDNTSSSSGAESSGPQAEATVAWHITHLKISQNPSIFWCHDVSQNFVKSSDAHVMHNSRNIMAFIGTFAFHIEGFAVPNCVPCLEEN